MRTPIHAAFWAAFTLAVGSTIAHGQAINNDKDDAAVSVAVTAAALTNGPCARTKEMSSLQRRIVAKAAEGPDQLRYFVFVKRDLYQLDLESTVAWLNRERSSQLACEASLRRPVVAQH